MKIMNNVSAGRRSAQNLRSRDTGNTGLLLPSMMTPRQESIIEDKTNAIKSARASDAKVSWMQNTQRHFLREEINRRMRAAQEEHENDVEQRRSRLKQLLKQEEEHTLQEMERRYDTTAERKKKMIALARQLRDKREKERQQYISHQLDRQFRVHCEELRVAESKRRDLEGNLLREAQLKTQQELQREQEEEERVYHELWKADARAKEERERQTMELQMQRHAEQQSTLLRQIEESKETKQKMKEQRLEEAARLKKLQEENLLLDQREKQQKVEERNTLRRLLDHSLTLKNDRLRREKEAELQQTKEFLAQVQQELMQDQEEAMRRKLELKAEQKAFHEYWQNHRDMEDKDEAEVQQLIDEALQKGMKTADERKLQLRQARGHLTTEVSDGRGLQMEDKLSKVAQKKADWLREQEEIKRLMQEVKTEERDEKRGYQEECQDYGAILRAQIQEKQQREFELLVELEREEEEKKKLLELENQKVQEIISNFWTPSVHTSSSPAT